MEQLIKAALSALENKGYITPFNLNKELDISESELKSVVRILLSKNYIDQTKQIFDVSFDHKDFIKSFSISINGNGLSFLHGLEKQSASSQNIIIGNNNNANQSNNFLSTSINKQAVAIPAKKTYKWEAAIGILTILVPLILWLIDRFVFKIF